MPPLRIQMEPTDIFVEVDGRDVRAWAGVTEDGRQCAVFVAAVCVDGMDSAAFERELIERTPPSARRSELS